MNSNPIQVFDTSTGQIVNSFSIRNFQGTLAVTKGGNTLLVPVSPDRLELASAITGQYLTEIKNLYEPSGAFGKTILSPSGEYAFVMGLVGGTRTGNATAIVNLKKQEVVGYILVSEGVPVDIALSPKGKQFFISTRSLGSGLDDRSISRPEGRSESFSPTAPVYKCTQVPGICVFSTPTFAVTANVPLAAGFLALSQDGSSLYSFPDQGEIFPLSVVNTTSFAVSPVDLGSGYDVNSVAIAPSGNQAVIAGSLKNVYSSLVLDTGCPNCNVLVGQSFPSGDVVAQTALAAAVGGIVF